MRHTTTQEETTQSLRHAEIANFPLFSNLAPPAIQHLASTGRRTAYPRGTALTIQGEPAEEVWLLLGGALLVTVRSVTGDDVITQILTSPAIVGEAEALTDSPRTGTVITARRSVVLTFERRAFERILTMHPGVCRRLLQDICSRLCKLAVGGSHNASATVESRLAAHLLSYGRVFGVRVTGGLQIVLEGLTHGSLAAGIAATAKSVQRTFGRWRARGWVRRAGRHYVITNVDALEQLTGQSPVSLVHSLLPEDS